MGRPFDPQQSRRERLLHRYVTAFDAGDLDGIDDILLEAERDAELSRQLAGVNEALFESTGLPAFDRPSEEKVLPIRRPVAAAMPRGPVEEPRTGLTVGDVAKRLLTPRAGGAEVPDEDRFTNRRLVDNRTHLPETITPKTVAELATRLGVEASRAYWEAFRQSALMLSMAASRPAGTGFMAARQRRDVDSASPAPETPPAKDDGTTEKPPIG